MIRRINIFGCPASGKSTTAAWLYSHLKLANINVELVRETAKKWAIQGKHIRGWDQWEVANEQLQQEKFYLDHGIDLIVTDCPLLVNAFYAHKFQVHNCNSIQENARLFGLDLPSINIFMNMIDRPYNNKGRFENREESLKIQEELKKYLDTLNIWYDEFDLNNLDEILKHCMDVITIHTG